MVVNTLPDPTGPITQMRSPGCASKIMFFNEKAAFYKNYAKFDCFAEFEMEF